jgi:iron-sulfur cluster repair protein YtfE (RIC family)
MTTISKFLSSEHAACDDAFAEAENQVGNKAWPAGAASFASFSAQTLTHFDKEEQVLFPLLDEAMGGSCGPVVVMRAEHERMRDALTKMGEALQRKDADDYLGLSETLLMMLQQHNHKEEFILYPMADARLAARAQAVLAQLQAP